ncbi:MAG: DUF951 domain-containing protein [Thermomicrobiales bacterium]
MPVRGEPLKVYLDDVVRLRKPHPCGGFEWTVVRLGADIGLRCHSCGRKVLLPRRDLEKRLKAFVSRGPEFVMVASELTSVSSENAADVEVR